MIAIDAEHLRKWILARWRDNGGKDNDAPTAEEILAQIDREIRFMSVILAPPQWTPITEGLPDESDDYLCSYGALSGWFVDISIYEAEKKEFGFYSDDEQGNEVWHPVKNVIAWMPIPEPYKKVDA